MHNWRFLLLAFVAVFQPIDSYTERGLVDGRQQRCDYRTASVLRDPGLHFHGTHRFTKPAVEQRRLNQRADHRENRRNEVKEESLPTFSSTGRRLVDTLERGDSIPTRLGRFSRTETRLARDGVVLRRETRGLQLDDTRKERNQEVRAERLSGIYENRRARLDSRQSSNRLSNNEGRSQIRIDNRHTMELRRDTRGNRDNTDTLAQEIRETRIVSDRRDGIVRSEGVDRRIARERAQRMDAKRSDSRFQANRNANLDQRYRNRELTRLSDSSASLYRTNNEETRMATRAAQSLDRDERRSTHFRYSVDKNTPEHDTYRNRLAINRSSVSDRRNIRQVSDRTEKTPNLYLDQTAESRRDVSRTDIRSLRRDLTVKNRRESRHAESKTRRIKETRLVENRVSQNSRRDSRILERERSVENRRDVRDIQDMERTLRAVERVAETRRDARSADRDRVSNNRREIRSIGRESRTMMTGSTGINERDVRTFVLNLERNTKIRHNVHKTNRDSCSVYRERSTDRQVANRDYEMVARALSADLSAENRRNTQNLVRDHRISGLERAADNRRNTRNVERESRESERNRIAQRTIRMNFRDISSIENEQSQASRRDNRNTESRTVRVERDNRIHARNVEERARSVERDANHRQGIRANDRDVRNIGLNRVLEARDGRNTHRESRARAASFESRRDIQDVERRSRPIEEDRIIAHRRATRSMERDIRSFRGERFSESRKDVRKVDKDFRIFGSERLAEQRRERASENRRDIRNAENDARKIRFDETGRVEPRINIARSRDLSMERRDHRLTERLNVRDTQLDRRSRSVRESRTETRRTFVRNNEESERRELEPPARKREFLSMIRNSSQDEDEAPTMNWQYIFYTLQGLYICGVLTQLMNERSAVKKARTFSWWSAPQHLIKVD